MNYILDLTIILSCLSLSANVALYVLLKRVKSKKPQMTYDAKALLSDLATGPALLKIEYVDRSDVLLRSPRDT